jgi:2-polyprenyl-3-methyl-5-hydroxy-6-metoxy-1,4-benzoquinol methylase
MFRTKKIPDVAFNVGRYYKKNALADRALVRLRPYICPFAPIVEWVPLGSSVLDIGCGGGLWLLTLAESGKMDKGIGFDINPHAIEKGAKAAESYFQSGGAADIIFQYAASIAEWPVAQQFDVVSLIDVLHHVPPNLQVEFLRHAIKLVKPGGRLIYKDMARAPKWAAWCNRLHDLVIAKQWIHYFPIEDAVEVVIQSGCSVAHRDSWIQMVYAHEFLVGQK